ncbi:hypothetical protein ISU10_12315 [Nocardioides agariphilus]|jgi:hypothetical protein|uniref:Uncharacterized protein n=1 Tax=Nocardioides agariphilus TaxID=433664 RepID=A0A930VPC0_9ACTN|nr:hypothetical protein [Nocardioides agariphilus]MBF4768548.1 hypothetical protein [Nocardioides agariphilus]
MTEAPDVYPEFPADDDPGEPMEQDAQGVEGLSDHLQSSEPVRTGHARVDAVLASLSELDERPVGEHAAIFERAHDELRNALDPDRETA